jgi:hypothetical protein
MKNLIFAILLFSSVKALAIEFKSDTLLSENLQTRIDSLIAEKCYRVGAITEVATNLEIVEVDQGQVDEYYTTILHGNHFNAVGEFKVVTINVYSIVYDIQNTTDNIAIRIKAPTDACNERLSIFNI